MTDPAPPPADDSASRLPRHTTPTWEVELLISGVAVFAMLQLPGWLDDRFFFLSRRFDSDWLQPLQMVYIYLESAALILAGTFLLHLLLRAQWIALVGMHSVFPEGIRWERLRMGPVQREVEAEQYPGRDATIDRADNRATIVFSFGVNLASTLLYITVLVTGIFAAIIGVAALTGLKVDVAGLLGYCTIAVFAPMGLAMLVDRRFGDRLREGGAARRVLKAALRLYGRSGIMQRSTNPTFSLLASHGGERRVTLLTLVVFIAAFAIILFAIYTGGDARRLGNYALFPEFADGSRTLDAAHYDDRRNPVRDPAVAFIDSMVADKAYLRLVVPYAPQTDSIALLSDCPAAASPDQGDQRAAALLDCLQRLHAVALDGKPLAALRYELGSDPRTDRPALVAMIDVRNLAPGRHELEVAHHPPKAEAKETPRPWRIPFWR
jgi:hypothetical protein